MLLKFTASRFVENVYIIWFQNKFRNKTFFIYLKIKVCTNFYRRLIWNQINKLRIYAAVYILIFDLATAIESYIY